MKNRIVVIVQWTPADIGGPDRKADPGTAPARSGDPDPAEIDGIVPSTVVVGRPAPWIVRDPHPACRIPDPPTTDVGTPITVIGGTPDPSIGPVVVPATIDRELENIWPDRNGDRRSDLIDRRISAPAEISLDSLVVKAIEIVEAQRIEGARFARSTTGLDAGALPAPHHHRPEITRQLRDASE